MERLTYRDARGEAWYADSGTEADHLHFIADIEDILGDNYDLDRLRELVEADRDGRCKVLPVKEGTPVFYVLNDPFVVEHPVIYEAPFDIRDYYDNDITVCFSLEDADAVLKGEKKDDPVKIFHIDCVKRKPLYGYDGKLQPELRGEDGRRD